MSASESISEALIAASRPTNAMRRSEVIESNSLASFQPSMRIAPETCPSKAGTGLSSSTAERSRNTASSACSTARMLVRISRATCEIVCRSCASRVSEFASSSERSSAGIGAFDTAYPKRCTARSTCVRNDVGSAAMWSSAVSRRIKLVANSIERSSLMVLASATDVPALAMAFPKLEKSGIRSALQAAGNSATDSRRLRSAVLRPALKFAQASRHRFNVATSA